MPRERTARRKRQWTGDSETQTIKATVAVAETIQLTRGAFGETSESRDRTHKFTVLDFHIRRLTVAQADGLGFVVWKGKRLFDTTTPVQPQVPFATLIDAPSDSDILLRGGFPIPPIVLTPSTDATAIQREVLYRQVEVHSMRRFDTANEGIFLQMQSLAGGDDVLSVTVTWRMLLLLP